MSVTKRNGRSHEKNSTCHSIYDTVNEFVTKLHTHCYSAATRSMVALYVPQGQCFLSLSTCSVRISSAVRLPVHRSSSSSYVGILMRQFGKLLHVVFVVVVVIPHHTRCGLLSCVAWSVCLSTCIVFPIKISPYVHRICNLYFHCKV